MATTTPNAEQHEYWNGEAAGHWLAYEEWYERMLRPFTEHLLGGLGRTDRLLDVGCGFGTTTIEAARRAADGSALGVDLSEPMLGRARELARRTGVENVRFERGDAQVHPFEEASFDVATSRFGLMFFADPAAGFANVARALRPGGRLVFVCWRELVFNEWMMVPGAAIVQHVGMPDMGEPGAPGPFALGDRDRLLEILGAVGVSDVSIDQVDEPLTLGASVDDAVEPLRGSGQTRRLLADADPPTAERAIASVREALGPHAGPDGVVLGSSAWLVHAVR